MYKAEKPGSPVHVYNLWYSRSLELDRYTAELQREQKVFEDLIQQKAYIVLPELAQVEHSICVSTNKTCKEGNCYSCLVASCDLESLAS